MPLLTFLGIAGNNAVTSNLLSSGGIVLNYKRYQIHIDPGTGALLSAREHGINPAHTNIILVSHNHLSHCNDLNLLIDAMTYKGIDQRGMLIADESVIHGTNLERPILSRTHQKYLEKIMVLPQGQNINLPSINIQGLKTQHSNPTTIGFKLTTEEFTIVYSSDTGYFDEMLSLYKDTDILILNTPFSDKTKSENNLNTKNAFSLISTLKPKLAILTHFSKEMLKENPLYTARDIQKQTNIQTMTAKEGYSINPANYSNKQRQKTLSTY